jgi:hypothetical protein
LINGHALNGSSRTMLAALKAAIRNGVLVMQAMDDLDYKFRRPLTSTWRISAPDDAGLAYAYNEIRLRLVPTPRDITRAEIVDSWLVWLHGVEGKRGTHRVFHWARGAPQWLLAQRENCSERTIVNRIDRSISKAGWTACTRPMLGLDARLEDTANLLKTLRVLIHPFFSDAGRAHRDTSFFARLLS